MAARAINEVLLNVRDQVPKAGKESNE
jgi:hypothetical protein